MHNIVKAFPKATTEELQMTINECIEIYTLLSFATLRNWFVAKEHDAKQFAGTLALRSLLEALHRAALFTPHLIVCIARVDKANQVTTGNEFADSRAYRVARHFANMGEPSSDMAFDGGQCQRTAQSHVI